MKSWDDLAPIVALGVALIADDGHETFGLVMMVVLLFVTLWRIWGRIRSEALEP